jgi:signal peptidase I
MWTVALSAIALTAVAVLGLVAARRRFIVVDIIGPSMQPTYRPGDRVLVRRRTGRPVRRGSVVVLQEPPQSSWPDGAHATAATGAPDAALSGGKHWMIKRVVAVPGDPVPESVRPVVPDAEQVPPGQLVVLGDGDRSADSRLWGFAPVDLVLGSVVRSMPSTTRPERSLT